MKKKTVCILLVVVMSIMGCSAKERDTTTNVNTGTEESSPRENMEQAEELLTDESNGDNDKKQNERNVVFSRNVNWSIPEQYSVYWQDFRVTNMPEIPDEAQCEYALVKDTVTGMYGLLDHDGNVVIEPKYNTLYYYYYKDGVIYFKANYEGEKMVLDQNGNVSDAPLDVIGDTCIWNAPETSTQGSYVGELDGESGHYILSNDASIISGPYSDVILSNDVFFHVKGGAYQNGMYNVRENRAEDEIGFYDEITGTDYMIDGSLLSDFMELQSILESEKIAVFYGKGNVYDKSDSGAKIYILNYETSEVLFQEATYNYEGIYGDKIVYEKDGTYKCVDVYGNIVEKDRYYDMVHACDGIMLKDETGKWLCFNKNGKIVEGDIEGTGSAPETYNGYPIMGFWQHEGISCIVTQEEDKQVGYSME